MNHIKIMKIIYQLKQLKKLFYLDQERIKKNIN